jgi:hypothetical protein
VAVSISTDHGRTSMICAVFHDTSDGEWIGKVASATILGCFISQFEEFRPYKMILNVSLFEDFHILGALGEIPLALLRNSKSRGKNLHFRQIGELFFLLFS